MKTRSLIWNHFEKISYIRAKCNYCSIAFSTKGGSTANLLRHLKNKHPFIDLNQSNTRIIIIERDSEGEDHDDDTDREELVQNVANSSSSSPNSSNPVVFYTHNLQKKEKPSYRNYCEKMGLSSGLTLQEVVRKLQDIAPLKLAESWDNVGLLVEPNRGSLINTILLTIDLTEDVVDEAVENRAQMIISYHPNIFRPIKSITHNQWKERILIKCIQNDIAVFSPHTTWDAMSDGVNDWLASAFKSKSSKPILVNSEDSNIGMGRIVTLEAPIQLKQAIMDVKHHIDMPYLRIGIAKNHDLDSFITTVAVCAGSGASVLAGIEADLYLTGEMLHHDVLDATQKGISVILCNHSDSERGYLQEFQKKFQINEVKVIISKVDKDCLTTI